MPYLTVPTTKVRPQALIVRPALQTHNLLQIRALYKDSPAAIRTVSRSLTTGACGEDIRRGDVPTGAPAKDTGAGSGNIATCAASTTIGIDGRHVPSTVTRGTSGETGAGPMPCHHELSTTATTKRTKATDSTHEATTATAKAAARAGGPTSASTRAYSICAVAQPSCYSRTRAHDLDVSSFKIDHFPLNSEWNLEPGPLCDATLLCRAMTRSEGQNGAVR